MYDVIIIGAGPAGLTAGLYAGRRGLGVLILEKQLSAGQLSKAYRIENYPGFPEGIAGFELAEKILECSKKAGCEIGYEEVVGLETQQQTYRIRTQNNTYQSRAVIISTGLKPKMLNIPGEDRLIGRGVSYCATCDGPFFKTKDVVVIGGGNQALCDAIYLSVIKCNVILIHRREEFRADTDVIRQFEKFNIKTFLGVVPEQIIGDNKVEHIILKSVQTNQITTLKTDAVFVHIGAEPETKLFSFLKLDENGYIITDKNFQTSQGGIFACGDVRSGSLKQVISACGEGASAGWNVSSVLSHK